MHHCWRGGGSTDLGSVCEVVEAEEKGHGKGEDGDEEAEREGVGHADGEEMGGVA